MNKQTRFLASLVAVGMLGSAPAALASDPVKDLIDLEVPALKDGSRIPLADVQRAILDACARRKFDAKVEAPGAITARWTHGKHWFDVAITFSESAYSISYKDSGEMDYNPKKNRIDDAYTEYVDGLNEHIEADLERALKRAKQAQKVARR